MASFMTRLNQNLGATGSREAPLAQQDVYFVGVTHQEADVAKEWGVVRSQYSAADCLGEAGQVQNPAVRELYERLLARKPTPGWDEIAKGSLRAVKCPIHSVSGVTNFCAIFDANADPKRVQVFLEKQVLMLGPVVEDYVEPAGPRGGERKAAVSTQRQVQDVLVPNLQREIDNVNRNQQLEELGRKVDDVKRLMVQNVDAILERQEKLEHLESQSEQLMDASRMFRTNARRLKRFHLMNQVKWGLAIGTAVTASIAIPIVVLVAV